MHLASEQGYLEIVGLLIEKGIDINQTNNRGENAFFLAYKCRHKEIVLFLIIKGIDTCRTDNSGQNVLSSEISSFNKEMFEYLVNNVGIDLEELLIKKRN